jgi:NADH-ubiquinone oxidoreductase chain 6
MQNLMDKYMNINDIYYASSNTWDNSLVDFTQISVIGSIIYTNYFIWLIIVSIILLLAMVGSIVITIKQK